MIHMYIALGSDPKHGRKYGSDDWNIVHWILFAL